eukprot:3848448-Amphidinium_carterae.1
MCAAAGLAYLYWGTARTSSEYSEQSVDTYTGTFAAFGLQDPAAEIKEVLVHAYTLISTKLLNTYSTGHSWQIEASLTRTVQRLLLG